MKRECLAKPRRQGSRSRPARYSFFSPLPPRPSPFLIPLMAPLVAPLLTPSTTLAASSVIVVLPWRWERVTTTSSLFLGSPSGPLERSSRTLSSVVVLTLQLRGCP